MMAVFVSLNVTLTAVGAEAVPLADVSALLEVVSTMRKISELVKSVMATSSHD